MRIMWIVLPTKGCECATCAKLREVFDENGDPVTGASVTDVGSAFREVDTRDDCLACQEVGQFSRHTCVPVRVV
jgi:hypothetical protein